MHSCHLIVPVHLVILNSIQDPIESRGSAIPTNKRFFEIHDGESVDHIARARHLWTGQTIRYGEISRRSGDCRILNRVQDDVSVHSQNPLPVIST